MFKYHIHVTINFDELKVTLFWIPSRDIDEIIDLIKFEYKQPVEENIEEFISSIQMSSRRTLTDKIYMQMWFDSFTDKISCSFITSIKNATKLLQVFADETLKNEIMREAFKNV